MSTLSSGNKCSYKGCGKSRRTDPNLIMHRFPSRQGQAMLWVLNSGNKSLMELFPDGIRKKYLCRNHFSPDYFLSGGKLNRDAIPYPFQKLPSPPNEHMKPKETIEHPFIKNNPKSHCHIDIIRMREYPDNEFRCVLVYQYMTTKFVILRPLRTFYELEVAYALLDIFGYFGAPMILQSGHGSFYVDSVIKHCEKLWPGLKLLRGHVQSEQQSKQYFLNLEKDIKTRITAWMAKKKTDKWAQELPMVQVNKNAEFDEELSKSPYEAMFGSPLELGLQNVPLERQLLANVHTEEELVKLLFEHLPGEKNMTDSICKVEDLKKTKYSVEKDAAASIAEPSDTWESPLGEVFIKEEEQEDCHTQDLESPNEENQDEDSIAAKRIKLEIDAEDYTPSTSSNYDFNTPELKYLIEPEIEREYVAIPAPPIPTVVPSSPPPLISFTETKKIRTPPLAVKTREEKNGLTEYEAVGINVSQKLQKMDPIQAIYAEALINTVLKRGLLGTLTDHTDFTEKT